VVVNASREIKGDKRHSYCPFNAGVIAWPFHLRMQTAQVTCTL
jgi:hypothetical protein